MSIILTEIVQKMINVLKKARKLINTKEKVCIVLGNESCDLDSAVSALAVAYLGQAINFSTIAPSINTKNFLPVLNIPSEDYSLKTEVVYLFDALSITKELLTFRDELSTDFLEGAQFILVDHHNSPWSLQCAAVYDHRPRDETIKFPDNCTINMELVASCCTLIAEQLINANLVTAKEHNIMELLRATIILDTVNFSASAQRATPKDESICQILEDKLKLGEGNVPLRQDIFDELVKARSDISHLTTFQLLKKDMKITSSPKSKKTICIPGFPITVQNLLKRPDVDKNLLELARFTNASIILLIGMEVISPGATNSVERDIGLINIHDCPLFERVKQGLLSLKEPNLQLEVYSDCRVLGGYYYKQGNLKVTRKHILPLVQQILMEDEIY